MSDTIHSTPLALVKLAVALAPGMLLTDTFKASGRGAMILERAEPLGAGAGHAPGAAEHRTAAPAASRRHALRRDYA
jgi:hypothetical protein